MKVVYIILIFFMVGVFLSIVPNIFGSFEVEHNVTVLNSSGYGDTTDEYEALTSLTQINLAVLMGVGVVIVIAMLLIMAKVMMR